MSKRWETLTESGKKISGNRVRKIEGNIAGKMGEYGGENGGKVERKSKGKIVEIISGKCGGK